MRLRQILTLLLFVLSCVATGDAALARKPAGAGGVNPHPDNPDLVEGPNYLTQALQAAITPKGMEVWMPGRMPTSNGEPASSYPFYPATIVFNNDAVGSLASPATTVKFAFRQWGYRCDLCSGNGFNHKPNEIFGGIPETGRSQSGLSFTTYERAMAAQIAVTLYVAGYPAHATGPCPSGIASCGYLDATRAAGIDDAKVIPWKTAVSQASAIFTKRNREVMTAVDTVILPPARLSDGVNRPWGVICVCEYADHRLASANLALQRQIAAILHNVGYKYAIGPDNPLKSGAGAGFCGVGQGPGRANCDIANLAALANAVDVLQLGFAEPPPKGLTFNQFMANTLALLGPSGGYPPSAISLRFTLGAWPEGTTIADAHAARAFLLANGWGSVGFAWIYTARGGGQCRWTTQKILILLGLPTGDCRPS